MSTRTPRHRAPQSAEVRRTERQGLLALIALPFLLAFLIWCAVRTDSVLLGVGLAVGVWGGMLLDGKRKARKRARQDSVPAD
ncbi:hypothetical protein [Kocuria turfanensis]|uniref:Uncharacterized protein n=1 Tax=Kocuria turfanensis TaxID=388357 RepID=A0A512IGL9_9MICC|nr:hypothetical protein [Kocuria turfanensis]GEO96817.1 hypothetical protein KTU01_29400 [Kocuria turfanensis]